jgi:hypothetical protein
MKLLNQAVLRFIGYEGTTFIGYEGTTFIGYEGTTFIGYEGTTFIRIIKPTRCTSFWNYLYSHNKTNEMHQFLKFIFGIEPYMFRAGFLSIIRSLVLYTQQ